MPDGYRQGLLIRELVDEADLHLQLVAGKAGINNLVDAVYIGDLEDPTPWMVQKSLLLTTGPNLEADPDAGPRLVRLMSDSGMAGVGVAILPHVTEIPPLMIAAADEAGLPLLRVPPGTPFREVASYVFNALASRDMHRLRRSLALQNQLLEASLASDGTQSLVQRLAHLLEVDIVLFDASGHVLEQAQQQHDDRGAARLSPSVWSAYLSSASADEPRSVASDGMERVHYREIKLESVLERVLAAVPPPASVSSEFMEAGLTYAQRLIGLSLAADRTVVGARRRTRGGLLEMIVEGRGGRSELEERLIQHGILATDPLWLAVIGNVPPLRGEPPVAMVGAEPRLSAPIAAETERLLEDWALPFLASPRQAGVIVLSSFDAQHRDDEPRHTLERLVAELNRRLGAGAIMAGGAAALTSIERAPHALTQAVLAQQTCGKRGDAIRVYDELGIGYLAVDSLPEPSAKALAGRVVGTLKDLDAHEGTNLLTTLSTFLESDCSHAGTAAELYIHRNTLRGRLERIERSIGVDLGTTDGVVEARLGLLADEVLEARLP